MTEKFALTTSALNTLSAYLPSSLTQQQAEKVLEASRQMAEVVWDEGRLSAMAERVLLNSFQDERDIEPVSESPTTKENN
jgi:hypothetical protein